MATYEQLPGDLSLSFRRGDEFGTSVTFDIPLSGYSAAATIVSSVHGGTVATFSTTVDATAGQVALSLTELQTAALAVGTYEWRLVWVQPGNVQRTALTGFVEVVA